MLFRSHNTIRSWVKRYGWPAPKTPKQSLLPNSKSTEKSVQPISNQSPSNVLLEEISANNEQSALHLSRYTRDASREASTLKSGRLKAARAVRDVAAIHGALTGDKERATNILQIGVILAPVVAVEKNA